MKLCPTSNQQDVHQAAKTQGPLFQAVKRRGLEFPQLVVVEHQHRFKMFQFFFKKNNVICDYNHFHFDEIIQIIQHPNTK